MAAPLYDRQDSGGDSREFVTWRELELALSPIRSELAGARGELRELIEAVRGSVILGPRGKAWVRWGIAGVGTLMTAVGTYLASTRGGH